MNDTIMKALQELTPEEIRGLFAEAIEVASSKKQKRAFSFEIKDRSVADINESCLTYEDIKDLRFKDDCCSIKRNLSLFVKEITSNSNSCIEVIVPLKEKSIEGKIFFNRKDLNSFIRKYEGCTILCSANISFSPALNCYSFSNITVYTYLEPLKQWSKFLSGKSLSERINLVLEVLGLNPEVLLYHEKIIGIARLLPLVVKKFLLLDISKKELGKTQTYLSLGFDRYTLMATRANIIVDGRGDKEGDFFKVKTAFIMDELSKITDSELITAFQLYMDGEKYKGKIMINSINKKESDTSIVILGNPKNKIDLLGLFVNQQQLFKDTIIMESSDGEAFVSRITSLLNSWGCRTFSQIMKSKKESSLCSCLLLKEALVELREKNFDINLFQEALNIQWKSSSIRTQNSIEKGFEGFVKILFPEYIDNVSAYQIKERFNEFMFLYERAMEFRKTVDNQLKIINPSNNNSETTPMLHSNLKNVIFNINKPCIFSPHRIFINHENTKIEKIALDCVGIELNKKEAEILAKNGKAHDFSDISLVHYLGDDCSRYSLYTSGANWGYNQNIPPDFYLVFNFLTGENELINKNSMSIFQKYSFGDLIKN